VSIDDSLIGRSWPASEPYVVSAEKVREFAAAVGASWSPGSAIPATFPIIVAGTLMNVFLADSGLDLSRIIHGEQRFEYARPLAVGDVLSASFSITSLRQMAGSDIIGAVTEIVDETGSLVCTTKATLIHRVGA